MRDRIDQYLAENGLAAPRSVSCRSRAMRPTGGTSASFRRTALRRCWRCTRTRSTSPRCRSRTSRGCCSRCRCRCPPSSATPTRSASWRCRISGDVTLQAHLGAASPAEHRALYRQAVSLIELLQRRGAELASSDYPPYGITFDVEKLTWELNFFVRHFLEAYRGAALGDDDRARSTRSGRPSRASWRRSRACCAIATITAAT